MFYLPNYTVKIWISLWSRANYGGGGLALTFLDLDALGLEEVPQLVDLLLQLADQLRVGVLVHHRLADDLLRPVGVPVFNWEIDTEIQDNSLLKFGRIWPLHQIFFLSYLATSLSILLARLPPHPSPICHFFISENETIERKKGRRSRTRENGSSRNSLNNVETRSKQRHKGPIDDRHLV